MIFKSKIQFGQILKFSATVLNYCFYVIEFVDSLGC